MAFPLEVTSSRGSYSSGSLAVRPRLPPGRSFRASPRDFWEPKREALPYPSAKTFRQFGTVSSSSYPQAIFSPFMVELFTVRCFDASPALVIEPVAFVAEGELPTRANVERT